MKKKIGIVLSVIFILTTMTSLLAGCKSTKFDNETSHLILSSGELDEVFNPFFASSGNDSSINAYTQLGLISTSSQGLVKVGADQPTIALDFSDVTTGKENPSNPKDYSNYYTTYKFLLKNGLKYSDGSPLTAKDVLFNFYVYLDPCYTGSTTMYSVDIKGLKAYRAQSTDISQQENSDKYFDNLGADRVQRIVQWCDTGALDSEVTEADIKSDIEEVKKLFRQELSEDWTSAASELESLREQYPTLTTQWQVFLMYAGIIQIKLDNNENKYIDFAGNDTNPPPDVSRDAMINMVVNYYLGKNQSSYDEALKNGIIQLLVGGWRTGTLAKTFFVGAEKEKHFADIKAKGGLIVEDISGITTYKHTAGEKFNGTVYNEEHEIVEVVINGVDPKAIWNFAVDIAPMKYYTTAALAGEANSENHFGVEFGSQTYMDSVVKSRMVPIGAGPYKAAAGKDFFKDNIVSMERNENFVLGAPKIKYLDFKVIATNSTFDAVQKGEVHLADPNAKPENKQKAIADKNLGYKELDNMGYGYIGINAKYVKELNVRRAFMHAMDTSLVLNYYHGGMATVIHRSMSTNSWAYPTGATAEYPYDSTGKTSDDLIQLAGYSKRGGVYGKENSRGIWEELRFTFTLAGDTSDHPAYSTMAKAAEILNNIGCKITVINDSNALSKLSSGSLAVWAAAWGSTIDPDMFQVYHKDSQATSILNWGYPSMLNNNDSQNRGNGEELRIIDELSLYIDDARKSLDNSKGGERAEKYRVALDLVMELAVELPTYQRKNLFVYRTDIIDENSLNKDLSAFTGPLSRIWEVSFK